MESWTTAGVARGRLDLSNEGDTKVALRRYSVFILIVPLGSACSPMSMAKRGFTELKGASGKVVPIREAAPAFYQSLGSLRIESVSNTIDPVCPASMRELITSALHSAAAGATENLSGTGVCTADVEITYHQPPKGVQALIGKGAILIGRARLLDEHRDTQADLLIGVFSRAMRTTESEMADTFGKTLADHVVGRSD